MPSPPALTSGDRTHTRPQRHISQHHHYYDHHDHHQRYQRQPRPHEHEQEWGCIQRIAKDGIVAALRIHATDLYVGLKFSSFGHIECYKWSNKALSLKWIACVAYVSCIAVLPSEVVLNGGPDGSVYNTTPNMKGPFLCSSPKCKCKQPFARRKDLEFHYTKIATIASAHNNGSNSSGVVAVGS